MTDDDLTARLRDAESALRGLHRRVLEAERELAETKRTLLREEASRQRAEDELRSLLATRSHRALRAPRSLYARLRRTRR